MKYKLTEIKIEVTQKCPLACIHCSSNANQHKQTQLTYEKCINLIDEGIALGVKELAFSGGEPLIWDGIFDVIEYAKSKCLNVGVYTSGNINGTNDVIKQLYEASVDRVIFSLYSSNKHEQERVTRKLGSYDTTIRAINNAVEYGIETEVHFVALKKTYHELKNIAELCKTLNVTRISVLRLVPQGRGSMLDTMSKSDNINLINIISQLRKKGYNIRTGSPFNVLLINDEPKCMAAIDRLIITPELKIYPCDAFKQIESIDIVGTEEYSSVISNNLKECWEKSPYLNFVRDMHNKILQGLCSKCPSFSNCLGGCFAQKYINYGDMINTKDSACMRKGN